MKKNLLTALTALPLLLVYVEPYAENGEQVYNSACKVCHQAGVAGAPKLGDQAIWNERAKKGLDGLLNSSINGLGAMPAKGGNASLSDADVKSAVEYMLAQTGVTAAAGGGDAQTGADDTAADAQADTGGAADTMGTADAADTTAAATADGSPQSKAATCAACHGADGNSENPEWPSLAGQHASYTAAQLAAFQQGEKRNNALMAPMVAGLNEQDMQDLGEYFQAQTPAKRFAVDDPEMLALGERLYRGGNDESGVPACMACHGPAGKGNGLARFPALSGQHATYAAAQLHAYKRGERSTDPNSMMRTIAQRLTDEEIQAVANYMTGLH
jgi:cytochrome c553